MTRSWGQAALAGGTAILAAAYASGAWAQTTNPPASGNTAAKTDATTVQTLIVTAEKRSESELEVPMGVTTVSGADLQATSSFRMEDFVGNIPGLTFVANGGGGGELVIRGITLGGSDVSSGVAIYIDETPFLASNPFTGNGGAAPDLDTYDMQRIEVLKGPQGTLYGSNALGGLFKYVTNPPDPSRYAGSLEAGVAAVQDGNVGYDYHGMINIPLTQNLAFRAVAYDNYYGGYIDDPGRGLKNINVDRFIGGRASLLYEPTPDWSFRFTALYQERKANDVGDGAENVNAYTLTPIYGNLTSETLINQPEYEDLTDFNVTVKWNTKFADILSSSSYIRSYTDTLVDYTLLYGPYTPFFLGGNYGVAYQTYDIFENYTQEVRVASKGAGKLQWQVGGYFTSEDGQFAGNLFPFTLPHGPILFNFPVSLIFFSEPTNYVEYAAFANVDYHFTPTFDVALGGRFSQNYQTYQETITGILGGPGGTTNYKQSRQGVFTYSADARWHFIPGSMLYARVAAGYVPGGPNDTFPGSPLPSAYNPATTINYEAGVKSQLLDDRLTAELSVYDIEWHDIQIGVDINGFGGYDNAGSARSTGVEWNFTFVPVRGLTLGWNGSYTHANLLVVPSFVTSSAGATDGARLPFSPQWQTSGSAEYDFPLVADFSGFGGVNVRYTGYRVGNFETSGPREPLPAFTIVDLRAGVKDKNWSLTLFVKNVANTIGFDALGDQIGPGGPQFAYTYRPRTYGATLAANF